jgi:hypothetical protein
MIHAPSMRIDRVIATYSKVKGEKRVGKNQDELYQIKINECTEWLLCFFFIFCFVPKGYIKIKFMTKGATTTTQSE